MEYHHEVMRYIVENEPLAATKLAAHFWWTDTQKRVWVQALRNRGWLTPSGYLESSEAGRRAVPELCAAPEQEND